MYVGFGLLCYLVYGDTLANEPIILSMLPTTPNYNLWIVSITKVLYCLSLIFTYPLVIHPANQIAENYMFGKWPKSKKRMYWKNFYRTIVVLVTVIISEVLGEKLGEFLSLLGALACTPVAFTLPAFYHYHLCAKEKNEKIVDAAIVVLSLIILVFVSAFVLYTWS